MENRVFKTPKTTYQDYAKPTRLAQRFSAYLVFIIETSLHPTPPCVVLASLIISISYYYAMQWSHDSGHDPREDYYTPHRRSRVSHPLRPLHQGDMGRMRLVYYRLLWDWAPDSGLRDPH